MNYIFTNAGHGISGESPFRLRRSQGMIIPADFKPVILAAEMRFRS